MKRYLLLVLLSVCTKFCFCEEELSELILSTPDQLSALSEDPGYLIGNVLNPLSGQPVLRQTDLIAKGAQDVILSRVYIPPAIPGIFQQHSSHQEEYDKKDLHTLLVNHYRGWEFLPHLKIQYNARNSVLRLSEPSGSRLEFKIIGSKSYLVSPPYAISNAAGDCPNGMYDPRNTRFSIDSGTSRIIVYATDGTIRYYDRKASVRGGSYIYFLQKEVLPNGKILRYRYADSHRLTRIESLDHSEHHVYAALDVTGTLKEGKYCFRTSSGDEAEYGYEWKVLQGKIREKSKNGSNKSDFNLYCPPVLTRVSSPLFRQESIGYSHRFLLESYTAKNQMLQIVNAKYGTIPHCFHKAQQLLLPVGEDDCFVPVYNLSYDSPIPGKKSGATYVKNYDGTATKYHFSKNLLLEKIEYFGQDGKLRKKKICSWSGNNRLLAVEWRTGDNTLFSKISYTYDSFGNPITETFEGKLTGEPSIQQLTVRKEFSQDGRHLLLCEKHDNGKIIECTYLPNTNLLTKKLVKDDQSVLQREFRSYDDCLNLIRVVVDDGSETDINDYAGVTQRLVTEYVLRQEPPFLHMPEWIDEKHVEDKIEKLLKRRHLIYDSRGHVSKEEVYDANDQYAYTLYREYNERGDLVSETDAFGHKASYQYDPHGRRILSTNFSGRCTTENQYDANGRLIKEAKQGDDGLTHETHSCYDVNDRLISHRDTYQNTTYYEYNTLVNCRTRSQYPPIASIEKTQSVVATTATYDPFGRELTKTNPDGHTTTYQYNIYDSPVEIIHSSGGVETFRYEKDGALASYTNCDGLTISYTRDVLGRVTAKSYISSHGEQLAKETFNYHGFHLIAETNRVGHVTAYTYDGAGRKIREEYCGRVTEYDYDALGHVSIVTKYCGDNTLITRFTRDLEGRVTEEIQCDFTGRPLTRISYSYDADGNCVSTTHYIQGKEAVEEFAFDAFGRKIRCRDAEFRTTTTRYEEDFVNGLGQRVLRVINTDSQGIQHRETHDALGHVVKIEKHSVEGEILSLCELFPNAYGDCLYQRDHIYGQCREISPQLIRYNYTPERRIDSITRGEGTETSRTTRYAYFPSGKLASKTMPDGVKLTYDYHPLGWVSQLASSEGSIRHAFEYDLEGHLLKARDEKQNLTISREVDPFGNVVKEEFPSGLKLKREYDNLNRLIALQMGVQGSVLYAYDPLFLRKVTRFDPQGQELYTHFYEEYDQAGNLVTERLLGDLGQVQYRYTLKGQKASIESPFFKQQYIYNSVGNLLQNVVDEDEYVYAYDGLSQLKSETGAKHQCKYSHDSLYNRLSKNGSKYEQNHLNELSTFEQGSCVFDLNGNQILKETDEGATRYFYDVLQRLVKVKTPDRMLDYVYDPLGRRISRTIIKNGKNETEHYLYDDKNEIGAFTSDLEPLNLRVLGLASLQGWPATVGIEIRQEVYAPLLDIVGNVTKLIDADANVVAHYRFTAFGEEKFLTVDGVSNPWRYASKRIDEETGLIYFGKRDYDSQLGRWLTPDPAGLINSANLYQYVFNNPFRYTDPTGEFAFVLPFLVGVFGLGTEIAVGCVATEVLLDIVVGAAIAFGITEGVRQVDQAINHSHHDHVCNQTGVTSKKDEKKGSGTNTNPFDGPVGGDVVVVDEAGNAIKVPEGNWLTGSNDGKWIQEMQPGNTPDGQPTGTRKDGGHPPGPKHSDPRGLEPHSHVPGVTNPDGTPWLPVRK